MEQDLEGKTEMRTLCTLKDYHALFDCQLYLPHRHEITSAGHADVYDGIQEWFIRTLNIKPITDQQRKALFTAANFARKFSRDIEASFSETVTYLELWNDNVSY